MPVFSTTDTDSRNLSGFTMVELLVAITIVGILLAVSVPGSMRFYDSIQYRQAVRDVLTTLGTARQQSIDTGKAQNVAFDPGTNKIRYGDGVQSLPEDFQLTVTTAREVNRRGVGVIRFYPEGGSSGGDVSIETVNGRGVMISVDWLMGAVSQRAYDAE